MSKALAKLNVGDLLPFKGPKVRSCLILFSLSLFKFRARKLSVKLNFYLFSIQGRFKYEPNSVRAFGMIGGGTGITPMYQVSFNFF